MSRINMTKILILISFSLGLVSIFRPCVLFPNEKIIRLASSTDREKVARGQKITREMSLEEREARFDQILKEGAHIGDATHLTEEDLIEEYCGMSDMDIKEWELIKVKVCPFLYNFGVITKTLRKLSAYKSEISDVKDVFKRREIEELYKPDILRSRIQKYWQRVKKSTGIVVTSISLGDYSEGRFKIDGSFGSIICKGGWEKFVTDRGYWESRWDKMEATILPGENFILKFLNPISFKKELIMDEKSAYELIKKLDEKRNVRCVVLFYPEYFECWLGGEFLRYNEYAKITSPGTLYKRKSYELGSERDNIVYGRVIDARIEIPGHSHIYATTKPLRKVSQEWEKWE